MRYVFGPVPGVSWRTVAGVFLLFFALAVWSVISSFVFLLLAGLRDAFDWVHIQWWWYLRDYWHYHGVPERLAASGALATLLVGGVSWRAYRMTSSGGRPLFGASRFATRADGERVGLSYSATPRPDTIILGRTEGWQPRYVGLPGTEHVLLAAKTRSGKGVSFVLPNCFAWGESLVVLDVKRENWDATAGHRKRMGQEVFLFQPLAEDGRTHCWNPLGDIDVRQPDYVSKLQRRAYDFFPEVMGRERFWQDGARSAFLSIAVLITETPGLVLNPATVFRWFARGDASAELARMIDVRRKSGNPYSQACVDLISDYLSGTEEVVKGVRKHVTATMGLWFNPKVAAATERSDFDLKQLRRRRMSVYVAVMPADLGQLGVLLRLFFTQLFESNTDVLPDQDRSIRYKCHVLLDEFTSIPAMRPLAKAAGFAAGFGLRFSFVVQSKNQVREEYKGQGEASLLENLGAEVYFGTSDPALCKEISERSGNDTVEVMSRSTPRWMAWLRPDRQSETAHLQKRALLLPQEVAQMPAEQELVFRASVPAFLLRKLRWFEDPSFRRLERRAPEVPKVSYTLARDDGTVTIPTTSGLKARIKTKKATA
ncbi:MULTISPECIES: type IV secretory system conjugative DNA transfer family protein [Roseicella]|uniref:Type IV secretory system conjugative DNA transfer family protein n=1 Tax=Roseicella aquatilis TaxID=2527868 RepID=A0A4R4D610_9PROT|nr:MULTISPECIES: type IV secretory system conjugative DNA transfer family protein [Roseicella]NOG73509.1 type IV secretory system conjugative DNA transfer family protein [Roseicella sp. DB1501]TCZ55785.1 type IV secretory system conjugative DNA transfer family protein [Roseicella aquatilis]